MTYYRSVDVSHAAVASSGGVRRKHVLEFLFHATAPP
jgi:hypothetical protein